MIPRAVDITFETSAIIYDALFIALAEVMDTAVVTADGKLLKALEGTAFADHALYLGGVENYL